jgi:hypothetical protein
MCSIAEENGKAHFGSQTCLHRGCWRKDARSIVDTKIEKAKIRRNIHPVRLGPKGETDIELSDGTRALPSCKRDSEETTEERRERSAQKEDEKVRERKTACVKRSA